MRKKQLLPFIFIIFTLFFTGCIGQKPNENVNMNVKEETRLGTSELEDIQTGIENLAAGPEKTVAVQYRDEQKGKRGIRWINQKGEIKNSPLHYSIAGIQFNSKGDLIYVAKEKQEAESRLFINGENKGVLGDDVTMLKVLDDDEITYIKKVKGVSYFVRGDEESKGYEYIHLNYKINPKGDIAFFARKESGTWVAVLNNEEGPEFSAIFDLAFNEQGRLGYVARQLNNFWAIVKDDETTQLDDNYTEIRSTAYSVDNLAFIGQVRERSDWHLVENGRDKYSSSDMRLVYYDAKGELNYTFNNSEGYEIISYGSKEISNKYWGVSEITTDKYGKTYFVVRLFKGFWAVLFDRTEHGEYKRLSPFKLIDGNLVLAAQRENGEVSYLKMEPETVK